MNEALERLRALIASGAVVFSVGSGFFLVGPADGGPPTVSVAAFNIQVFGDSKSSKPEVMDILARTARRFDVLVVQEIRDSDEEVADDFLDLINQDEEASYSMFESARLGRTSSKEQYAIYFRNGLVELDTAFVPEDPDDVFEREPIVVGLTAGDFDFKLVAIHIKPDSAQQELTALQAIVEGLLEDDPEERDVIVLGDLNADCDYLDEDDPERPFPDQAFEWVIANDLATSTKTDCTYDRIILTDDTFAGDYSIGSADVFRFDEAFGLTDEDFIHSVSDHYPVFARFTIAELVTDP